MGEPAQSIQTSKATTDSADYTDIFVSSVLGSGGTVRRKGKKQIHPHGNRDRPNLNHYTSSLLYPELLPVLSPEKTKKSLHSSSFLYYHPF